MNLPTRIFTTLTNKAHLNNLYASKMFSQIRKWLFPEKKKGKLLSRFPPCMSMKMIPPLNINTKGTLFHLAQLCLLCNLLFFQLSKKTIQFLGSLGYNNRLRIFILPHKQFPPFANLLISNNYTNYSTKKHTQVVLILSVMRKMSNLNSAKGETVFF